MPAKLKVAAFVLLLGGCAQAPPPYPAAALRTYLPEPVYYSAPPVSSPEPPLQYAPPVPVPQARTREPPHVIEHAEAPAPVTPKPAKPSAPAPGDPDCPPGSWWDICHFL